jgi:DNA-binding transcriptional MerR regulator/methylmalonyl-CoA mutase cobalamin-binding subunit
MIGIKKVAQMAGVSEHTLRAWEKRYGAIVPARSSGGRREYSVDEVKRIRLLSGLVQQGSQIGQIASLETAELEDLWFQFFSPTLCSEIGPRTQEIQLHQPIQQSIQQTLDHLQFYRIREIMSLIQHLRLQMDVRTFLLGFVTPLLSRLGALVAEKKLDVSHEHSLSAVLKHFLSDILFGMATATPSVFSERNKITLVFATPEYDYHEFGIHIAACLAAIMGYNIFYLGCNVPHKSLVATSESLGSSVVVLGTLVFSKETARRAAKFISQTRATMNNSVQLWVGGNLEKWDSSFVKEWSAGEPKVQFLSSFDEFELAFQSMAH